MKKTAIEAAGQLLSAKVQPSKHTAYCEMTKIANSGGGRFPPIEMALSAIMLNKHLDAAIRDA